MPKKWRAAVTRLKFDDDSRLPKTKSLEIGNCVIGQLNNHQTDEDSAASKEMSCGGDEGQ